MTTYWPFPPGSQPPYDVPSYGSTVRRHPRQPLVPVAPTIEHAGPVFSPAQYPAEADLSRVDGRDAMGQRIIVAGRVTDEADRPIAGAMIELWQANAAGRYHHERDNHDAPLDPHFRGAGRVFTDGDGSYRFVSIKPGAYPWRNHPNAWRPNHIHFSLFGASWGARLVTQMYFPGDPLLAIDPVFLSIPDTAARARLVSAFDLTLTQPEWALGYRFDIVLRGLHATPFEGGR
ncbi:MAG: protocatechuate 3,4-dioxygenase subunit beta [Deltaproteobacteria bacterium]|nr:MAG: protocatechuate 3,4-dioxygenase subunit beta [Deltaproteobacteria bacterium]TMQ22930.1 MAG: protocatechuate 3,4-dioxygenase subunit beta [Deltaproteobacteria bacterium]